jgi:hypothetical protein
MYNEKYHSRKDTDRFNADLYIIGTSASADFDMLRPILSRTASPSYSPSSLNRQKLLDIGDRIYNHSKDMHKVLDSIQGREDWSKLSPKPPTTPTDKGKDFMKSGKKVTFTPSTGSSGSRSARSSPSSMRATVEEVIDAGEDEEAHAVSSYHIDPEDFHKTRHSPQFDDKRKQTTPRLVLRQPTDPNDLEPAVKSLNLDESADKAPNGLNMFNSGATSESPKGLSSKKDAYSLTTTSSQNRSSEELEEQIRRHREELRRLREELHSSSSDSSVNARDAKGKGILKNAQDDPFGINDNQSSEDALKFKKSSDSTSSSSYYHSAQSKPHSLDWGRPSNNSSSSSLKVPEATRLRPRAATMSAAESARRPAFGDQQGNVPRPPYVSPRYSPYASSSENPSPRVRTSGVDPFGSRPNNSNSSQESVYGQPHNTSLPAVLEHGNQRENPDRNRKRASWAPADDFNAGDFTLFDSSDPALSQNLFNTPQPSNTASSPASKQNVAPGNIIQDLPVSLSDLYAGAKKRVSVQRLLPDSMSGQLQRFADVFEVQVYAGLRPGSRITMPKLGNYVPQLQTCGDLVFVLVEKPHDTFTRDGRDLIMRTEVTLYESLCGWSRNVTTLCGQTLQVSLKRPTPPGEMVPVGTYGMPKFVGKDAPPGPRGELILKVDVRWPTSGFDSRQRALLRQALGEGGKSPRC